MKRPRAVPWLAAPAAFVAALAVLVGIGLALEAALNGRDNWQVNAPAIAGLTAILLLAPSSPTQQTARNPWLAAIVGLAVVGGGYGVPVAGHEAGTPYGVAAFLITTVGGLAGCLAFTAVTHVEHWTAGAVEHTDSVPSADPTDADATEGVDVASAGS